MCLSFLKENNSQTRGGISISTLAGLKLNKGHPDFTGYFRVMAT